MRPERSDPPSALGAHTLTATYQLPQAGPVLSEATSPVVAASPVPPSDPAPLGDPAPFVQRLEPTGGDRLDRVDVIPAPVSFDLVDASLLDPVLAPCWTDGGEVSQFSNLRRDTGNRPKLQRTLPALTPDGWTPSWSTLPARRSCNPRRRNSAPADNACTFRYRRVGGASSRSVGQRLEASRLDHPTDC